MVTLLAMTPYPKPPVVVSTTPLPDGMSLVVSFSESMDPITTLDGARYEVNHGIQVTNVSFASDYGSNGPQSAVRLELDQPLEAYSEYSLTISDVFAAGSALVISPNPTEVTLRLTPKDLGYLYLSPVPNAEYVLTGTRYVLVRFTNITPDQITNLSNFISVTGTSSGNHPGQSHIATDGRTVVFTMSRSFTVGELVTVNLTPQIASEGGVAPCRYQFVVAGYITKAGTINAVGDNLAVGAKPGQPGPAPSKVVTGASLSPSTNTAPAAGQELAAGQARAGPKSNTKALTLPNGVSIPSDFPRVIITARGNPAQDYIWLENVDPEGPEYKMILDNNGYPVFYQRGRAEDMMVQLNGQITWERYWAYDQNFNFIRNYDAANGYYTDTHELRVMEDGSYYVIGLGEQRVDMSRFIDGGNPAAEVTEDIVQKFTAADELVLQFRAWDHFDVLDQQQFIDLRAAWFDFPHMNAIEIDLDGDILVSSRSTSEITKFSSDTGEIIWRLGGIHSDFAFVNDPLNGFYQQHSIRAVGPNRYILFDNGNQHNPPVSRAVEYELDLKRGTATLVWEFRDTPDKYVWYQGNVQRLTNGNTHINWCLSSLPKAVEVDSNGVKQLELNLAPSSDLYRSWRAPWTGSLDAPYLIAELYPDNVTLIFNKFGDHSVDHYRIYGSTSPNPTNLLATSRVTLTHLKNVVNGTLNYFRVTAVSTNGVESPYSNEESLMVNIAMPGRNLVQNGDFAQGTDLWTWIVGGTASAAWSIVNGSAFVDIASPGSGLTDIELRQAGLQLLQGQEYVLAFDAWSTTPRPIEVRVRQNQSPYTTYTLASPSLTAIRRQFFFTFVMKNATDLSARLEFNLGAATADVYLDDIVVFMVARGDFNRDGLVDNVDLSLLTSQWLQQGTALEADLNGDGRVDFYDLAILGQNWTAGTRP